MELGSGWLKPRGEKIHRPDWGINPGGVIIDMKYICVKWAHNLPSEPVLIISELDDLRYERRKIEFFLNGPAGVASSSISLGPTRLSLEPIPSLSDINSDPQFDAVEIDGDEFERAWMRGLEDFCGE